MRVATRRTSSSMGNARVESLDPGPCGEISCIPPRCRSPRSSRERDIQVRDLAGPYVTNDASDDAGGVIDGIVQHVPTPHCVAVHGQDHVARLQP